jgi:hypothetical protein
MHPHALTVISKDKAQRDSLALAFWVRCAFPRTCCVWQPSCARRSWNSIKNKQRLSYSPFSLP